jgi:AcrR family transcriptional regulator
LIGLAREKPYDSIAVKEILDVADVGKSTFYTHFGDKDDLLASGIREVVRAIRTRPSSTSALERVLAFSLPMLQHIDGHRRDGGPEMARESRDIMHEHLQEVLTNLIADDVAAAMCCGQATLHLPADLVARHIASTFVLVLEWWVKSDVALTPAEVDARFRTLVLPTLKTL